MRTKTHLNVTWSAKNYHYILRQDRVQQSPTYQDTGV